MSHYQNLQHAAYVQLLNLQDHNSGPQVEAIKVRCKLAAAIMPKIDNIVGNVMGLASPVALAIASFLCVLLIFLAVTNRVGGIFKALAIVIGAVAGLAFIGGVVAVVGPNSHC